MSIAIPSRGESRRLPVRLPWLILALSPLVFGLWVLVLGQDANWDLRNYHWYNAYAFLTGRWGQDVAPAQVASFYNPTLDVPLFLAGQVLSARWVGFLLGTVQGCNLPLLFGLAWVVLPTGTRHRWALAFAIAVCGMVGGGQVGLLGTSFYDNVISLFVLGGFLVAVSGRGAAWSAPPRAAFARMALAGLLVGSGVGLKQPTIVYAVGGCLACLLAGGGPWRRLFLAFFFGIGVLAGMALFSGHWLWFLWTHFQNPLFPYFNDIFHSPWALPHPYRDDKFLVRGWGAKLLFPLEFSLNPKRVGEVVFRDYRVLTAYAVVLLTLALTAWTALRRRIGGASSPAAGPAVPVGPDVPRTRYLLAAAGGSYLVWLQMFAIYRYLIPLEMLSPVVIAAALGCWPLSARARSALLCALLLALAATGRPGNWVRIPWGERVVSMTVPTIARPDHTIILMTGYAPTSYLITGFPPQIPFLRLQSYFIHPDQGDIKLNTVMRDRVSQGIAAGDDFYLLLADWETWTIGQILPRYGLRGADEPCRTVTPNLGEPMMLCRAVPAV